MVNDTIQDALQKALGSQLIALYEINAPNAKGVLFAIIENISTIHQIRETVQPIWHASNRPFRLPPIATPDAFQRHLTLNPILADRLTKYGRLLTGRPQPIPSQPITPAEEISYTALIALTATQSIAPALLSEKVKAASDEQLHRLANELQLPQNLTTVQTVAKIQAHLAGRLNRQPGLIWHGRIPSSPPPLVNDLLAIYETQDKVVFHLPDESPELVEAAINKVDWTAVAENLKDQYNGLQLTTPTLFRLIYQHWRTADTYLHSYQHAWGQDPLATLQPTKDQIYRNLAYQPSQLEIEIFPTAYITANIDQLDMLIHDFQNKLLNIQLREELMSRFEQRPQTAPPISLPDRHTPPHQRITAIFQHVNWWANYYSK